MRALMRIPGWIPLAAAVLLLGFELSMLGIGLFGARVSPAYRDYFIDRRTVLWAGEPAPHGPVQESGRTSR